MKSVTAKQTLVVSSVTLILGLSTINKCSKVARIYQWGLRSGHPHGEQSKMASSDRFAECLLKTFDGLIYCV